MSEDMSQFIDTFKNILHNNSEANFNSKQNTSSDVNETARQDIPNASNTNNSSLNTNNLNISPEMINNIANMLKNSNLTNNNNSNPNNQRTDDNSNSQNNANNNSGTNSSIDFDTIMKIKSMMDKLNKKDDPRSNLLYSLKPYLRKSRQDKLDQYVNLLKITQVTDIFNFKKGDKK